MRWPCVPAHEDLLIATANRLLLLEELAAQFLRTAGGPCAQRQNSGGRRRSAGEVQRQYVEAPPGRSPEGGLEPAR